MTSYAFIFPGQGSQHAGMGRALHEAFPESARVFQEADDALGEAISTKCFGGPEEELAKTETTQPAILAVSIAALRPLQARGLSPAATAGHSLGEYSAHVAAGSLVFADALRTVRLRGRFMQEAVPLGKGAMAALIGLDRGVVQRICDEVASGEVVAAANHNGPGQVVIAGHAGAVGRAVERALAEGARKAVPLPVSAPFHCSLMEPAAERLRPVLEALPFLDPWAPVYTNVDAAPVRDGASAREGLARQVVAPVRWQEVVEAMADDGIDTFVEIGPGRVLSGLTRRIRKGTRTLSVSDPQGVEEVVRTLGGAP